MSVPPFVAVLVLLARAKFLNYMAIGKFYGNAFPANNIMDFHVHTSVSRKVFTKARVVVLISAGW